MRQREANVSIEAVSSYINRQAVDGFGVRLGYVDNSYDAAYDAMVDDTNEDPELRVLNHLLFDLLTPWSVEEKARAYGLTEVQHLMKKFWLPWLQQGGKGHFYVIRHMVRQLYLARRRAAHTLSLLGQARSHLCPPAIWPQLSPR